jgi:hypothetical protein
LAYKLLVMKNICILILITSLLTGCSVIQSDRVSEPTQIEENSGQGNNMMAYSDPLLYKYYKEYERDLQNYGVQVPDDVMNLYILDTDEAYKNSPLPINFDKKYNNFEFTLLISKNVMVKESTIKAVMYKALTERLQLNLTEKDSRVLSDTKQNLTNEDYDKLLKSISEEWDKEFIVVELVEGM